MTFAILTNTGRNKEVAAMAQGTALSITEIAWGDGERVPSGGEVSLQNEQGRKEINNSGTVDDTPNSAFFEIFLDETEGPFIIRELGLFDVDGDMIAVAHYDPAVNKPLNTTSLVLSMRIVFSDLENLVLNVQSNSLYVSAERTIIAGNGLAGGGALDGDVTLSVDFASEAEATAGLEGAKASSPLTVAAQITRAIDALAGGAPGALDTLKELADALAGNDDAVTALTAGLAGKVSQATYDTAIATINSSLAAKLTATSPLNASRLASGTVPYARLPRATEDQAIAGTDNITLMTPYRTKQAMDTAGIGQEFGVGQTWRDMSDVRLRNTWYQNTTGKPIQLFVKQISGGDIINIGPSTTNYVSMSNRDHDSDLDNGGFWVVPDNNFYRITTRVGDWFELR